MAVLYTPHFIQFLDDNGDPLSGGKLYTYAAGTSTLKATYTTATGDIENSNPVILDSSGRATVFISGAYKFILTDADDVHIKTTDNVTAFTSTGETSNSFFQTFSGDGETTVFTASEDLGKDEKLIMVFVDDGRMEHTKNGDFALETGWTLGAGWTIGSGVSTATGAISTAISQTSEVTINEGQPYVVTMTITRDAGSLTPSVGGTSGTARSSEGTYSEIIIAGSTQAIAFTGASFTGTLDNVSVKPVSSAGFDILATDEYTIDGTTLTLANAPNNGNNNIQLWAPSILAAAAATSAESAASSANSAATSAALAATSAAESTDVSTTSLTIGTGSKTFTVSSGKSFSAGMYITATDQANSANYMQGFIESYLGTSLVVVVQGIGGSGTISAWNIYPSATYLSFIASQAEAEAGTSSTKLMSPERTAQAISAQGTPVGIVCDYAGSTAPSGWALCYGQEISRTTYDELFTAIGTTFGVGDGSTTFNLPDCRGRATSGKDNMGGTSANRLTNQTDGIDGDTLGAVGGSETNTLTEAQMPEHTHQGWAQRTDTSGDLTGASSTAPGAADKAITTSNTNYATDSAGSGSAHNNVQPTIIFNKIIKL